MSFQLFHERKVLGIFAEDFCIRNDFLHEFKWLEGYAVCKTSLVNAELKAELKDHVWLYQLYMGLVNDAKRIDTHTYTHMYIGISLFDVHLNWWNWLHFLIIVAKFITVKSYIIFVS